VDRHDAAEAAVTFNCCNQAAIVGIGQTEFAKLLDRTETDLACEAILRAADDAGIDPRQIDGIARYDLEPATEVEVIYTLGIPHLRFYTGTASGGGGLASVVGMAALAVAGGAADTVVAYRSRKRSKVASFGPAKGMTGRPWEQAGTRLTGRSQYHHPYGVAAPVQEVALIARRHMHAFGTKAEHFGMQAVVQRFHAGSNPAAMYRTPITLEDWANSRMISDPIHLLDCSLENDGAVALIVTSAERAKDLRQPPVYIMSFAQGEHPGHYGLADYFRYTGVFGGRDTGGTFIGRTLFDRAGVTPADVDAAMIFDHFTPAVLMSLEQYGFCPIGDGGPFVEAGETRWPSGKIPVNTHGGSTSESSIHGFNHYPEAVRQLRGTAYNQVSNCEIVFVCGAITDPAGAVLLRR
jgi:acetyl-CoA acetyltransferase